MRGVRLNTGEFMNSPISYVYINDLCSRPRRARPDTVLTVQGGRVKNVMRCECGVECVGQLDAWGGRSYMKRDTPLTRPRNLRRTHVRPYKGHSTLTTRTVPRVVLCC